ncbi:toll/interleukin-1 receptor domain-containing protein [Frankia sp. ACN1ag]|uniref:toll/interleukin-1 receptor domain-containing protein n=2 Tax=Frankia sp. ACN1ag TaxID=102891 RepID=UPI0009F99BF5
MGGTPPGWDFFVSYTSVDRGWAEWIAWQLEDAGYRVLIQAWDFVPGANWAIRMQQGVVYATRTIALLSSAYLTSVYGQSEWQSAQAADPLGFARKLLPIRVEDCPRPGLLGNIVSIDLFLDSPGVARAHLLKEVTAALEGRAKPAVAPEFPTPQPGRSVLPAKEPEFPGPIMPSQASVVGLTKSSESHSMQSPRSNSERRSANPPASRSAEFPGSEHRADARATRVKSRSPTVDRPAADIRGKSGTDISRASSRDTLDRVLSVLSYIPFVGWLTAFRRTPTVRFHTVQAFEIDAIFIVGTTLGTVGHANSIAGLDITGEIVVLVSAVGLRLWLLTGLALGLGARIVLLSGPAERAARRNAKQR